MTNSLPKVEIFLYFIIWGGGVVYSVYNVYRTGRQYYDLNNPGEEFIQGWPWLGGILQDRSDYELNSWINFLIIVFPWLGLHLSISLFTNFVLKEAVCIWYILVSCLFLFNFIGVVPAAVLCTQPVVFYLLKLINNKILIWTTSLMFLVSMMYFNWFISNQWQLDDERCYMMEMAMYWMHLRCLSLSLDEESYSVFEYFSYSLYLPTLFLGPHITIYHFFKQPTIHYDLKQRLCNFILELSRYLFWLFIIELSLHFIYINALQLQIDFIESLNGWTMNGLGYCMGQYFHLKYVVFYGIATSIARCEGIEAPSIPKCVARIHKYSDMWRYFDRGLYLFLTRYLYYPWCQNKSSLTIKLGGSLLCFTFVWLWHGPSHLFVGLWSFMNFVGVSVEAICKELNHSLTVTQIKSKLSEPVVERIEGVLAVPLTILSIMSNIYFFGGMEVGNAYIRYIFKGGWTFTVIFIYSLRHVSVTTERWEKQKQKKVKGGL